MRKQAIAASVIVLANAVFRHFAFGPKTDPQETCGVGSRKPRFRPAN